MQSIGEQLNLTDWSPLIDAATHAITLAYFLTRFILAAGEDASPAMARIKKNLPPGSFLEALWLTLDPCLGNDDLTVDHVAKLLSLSRQTLQRRLKANGTNLTQELVKLKQQHAIEELVHTDRPVAEIG